MAYRHDYDKTLTRLNTIIARLNDGEELSVKELAQEFNVSDRTIQRDFNERLISLYPIYQNKRKWKMQDGFKIQKATSIEDNIVLDMLEQMTVGLGAKFSSKAKYLLSKIKNDEYNPIYAKLNMEDISTKLSEIAMLEDAIKNRVVIDCVYDFVEYTHKLSLKPLKIANFEGFWYLLALDNRNDELKKYHLKSITSIRLCDEKFETNKKIEKLLENSINIWFDEDIEPFEIRLYLDPLAAKILKRKPISASQIIESEDKDGGCEISLKITHEKEITSIIKYWIPHIKVVKPDWLRDSLMEDVKNYFAINQT
jgi:predicted DNA-binding transcriptional regulator YafY